MSRESNSHDERMRRVSERVDLALNAEKDDSFMEFKPSDIQLFIDANASLREQLRLAMDTLKPFADDVWDYDDHDIARIVRELGKKAKGIYERLGP